MKIPLDLELVLELLVASAAVGGLVLGILERKSRIGLEKRLSESNLALRTDLAQSHLTLSLENNGASLVRVTGLTVFVGDEGYLPNSPEKWKQILRSLGLSSPRDLELHAHCFELPLTIAAQTRCELLRGQFNQSDAEILTAIRKIKVKISSSSLLGKPVTKVIIIAPSAKS